MRAWHEEPITKQHNRESFDCGDRGMNEFLHRHARKSHEQGGAKTFLAVSDGDLNQIFGYYSLSPASIAYAQTPDVVRRGLGRYEVPAFRLARLAVDLKVQGAGLGGQLLMAAGRRCLRVSREVGGVALLIDAISERAALWYTSYGAIPLLDSPQSLVLPLATIESALIANEKSGNR